MKIYISADIEGVNGSTHLDETDKKNPDYAEFQEQMTAEVLAACQGALNAGAKEIWVKDAHDTARNIKASSLPAQVKLLRGWSGHPFCMVEGLDETFDALLLVGYHSRAGSNSSPLAHTISGKAAYARINERYASELLISAYTAGWLKVPLVFVSGDAGLCEEATELIPDMVTVAVKRGVGNSTINIHPQVAIERIRTGAQQALEGNLGNCRVNLPERFHVEIRYEEHSRAYQYSFYPGASLADPFTLRFEAHDYFDVLRLFAFVL